MHGSSQGNHGPVRPSSGGWPSPGTQPLLRESRGHDKHARRPLPDHGFRAIIAYRVKERSIFLYGFAKNERDNIDADDLEILKKLARQFLPMSAAEIERAIEEGELIEVEHDD
ncbi:hypothetical protein D1O30_03010 [Methylocystis hirsuta]|uniref:Type II toxin-antitoxin system RelE/ParE family toxin n=1 Tax=Methylocystis hirsuta TaxID=369798 RepID=A0A3M9XV21_9HYPH|nr:hypothetical protein D1O30_03010 [Methylocystis hirsuta]